MATDFSFSLENRPGTGAQVLEALGRAGVNVIGVCAVDGGRVVHLAVEDAAGARQALQSAQVQVQEEREVLVAEVQDRPGAGGQLLRRFADAGVNLEFLYLATNTRVVIGAEDLERARGVL